MKIQYEDVVKRVGGTFLLLSHSQIQTGHPLYTLVSTSSHIQMGALSTVPSLVHTNPYKHAHKHKKNGTALRVAIS